MDLAAAQRKLGQHAQVDPELWSVKLIQAFVSLGCTLLEVETPKGAWRMRAQGAPRGFNLEHLGACLAAAGLNAPPSSGEYPERYLAQGLLGMSAVSLRSAAYQGGGQQVDNLLAQDPVRPSREADVLLDLEFTHPCLGTFPLNLWRRSLMFCPLRVRLRGREIGPPECSSSGPYWYEAVHLSSAGLGLWGLGRAELERGQDRDSRTLAQD